MVESDAVSEKPYLLYLNVARTQEMIDEATYERLLPRAIRKNPESLVDPTFIDQLMEEKLEACRPAMSPGRRCSRRSSTRSRSMRHRSMFLAVPDGADNCTIPVPEDIDIEVRIPMQEDAP